MTQEKLQEHQLQTPQPGEAAAQPHKRDARLPEKTPPTDGEAGNIDADETLSCLEEALDNFKRYARQGTQRDLPAIAPWDTSKRTREIAKALGITVPAIPALETPEETPEAADDAVEIRNLPLSDLRPGAHQLRRNFDEEQLTDLAESIRRRGVLQPILVRPLDDGWEIVAGERRWRAAQSAGLREIPATVRQMSDYDALLAGLVENLQREDLNPMERARGISALVTDLDMTHADAGNEVGLTRSAVSNTLRLLELPPDIQQMIELKKLNASHARALFGLDPETQAEVARQIDSRGLTSRQAQDLAEQMTGKSGEQAKKAGLLTDLTNDAILRVFEKEMSARLLTRVEIHPNQDGGGKLTIHFDSLDALNYLARKLWK